jgi:peroxiredoxin
MSLLRSIFISLFITWLTVVSIYSLLQLLRGMEPLLSWAGLALTVLAQLAFFAWIFAARPLKTARHPVEYSIASALGLVITMVVSWRYGQAAGMVHAWAGFSVVMWFLYLRWYSVFPARQSASLATGLLLPDFELVNDTGEIINSALFRGKRHIFVFHRGNWCPFCTTQVKEMAARYRDIEQAGAQVVFVSPQSLAKNLQLAKRFNVPALFLSDPGSTVAKILGIQQAHGVPAGMQILGYDSDTTLPTVFISDADGRIVFADETDNYRVRPDPERLLDVLRESVVTGE